VRVKVTVQNVPGVRSDTYKLTSSAQHNASVAQTFLSVQVWWRRALCVPMLFIGKTFVSVRFCRCSAHLYGRQPLISCGERRCETGHDFSRAVKKARKGGSTPETLSFYLELPTSSHTCFCGISDATTSSISCALCTCSG
jgi:hypothetical protein